MRNIVHVKQQLKKARPINYESDKIMKMLSNDKIVRRKNKFLTLNYNNTAVPSPVDQKILFNDQTSDQLTKLNSINPNKKRFNVRRLNRTDQSKSNSKEKTLDLNKSVTQKIQNSLKKGNYKLEVKLTIPISKPQKIYKLNNTLDVQKRYYRPPRFQTQHSSHIKKANKSPYNQRFQSNKTKIQIRNQNDSKLQNNFFSQKQKKFSFMTKFELQQLEMYEVYFPGQRRIQSIKHFTDHDGNAKVSIGDSIAYRYEIKSPLGQGSFGQVFKSYDHKKKEEVAIKIIKNQQKFNRQAKVQIKILQTVLMYDRNSHYNIVKLKHAFVFRGHACLVFQLLHINLYEFLKMNNFKGLKIDLIRRVAIQILQGLLFFQKFNIIHCDLKPENVLLKNQNKTGIKIIDVGSGTFQEQQLYTYIQSRFYRAPQIILGIRYSSKIDIWSFACILCELYMGYPIFPGQNEQQQMLMLMETLGVPPSELIDRGKRSSKFFDQYQPKIVPNSKGKIRTPGSKPLKKHFKNCEDTKFMKFIQKCFRWIPEQRLNPKQALLDEWILQGLPLQIRQQHIDIVQEEKLQIQKN